MQDPRPRPPGADRPLTQPKPKRNPAARIAAVAALLAVAAIVFAIVSTTGGSSGDGKDSTGESKGATKTKLSPAGRKAVAAGKYTVKPGDTLLAISAETGIPIERIERLNPNIDPQTLTAGQKIRLR